MNATLDDVARRAGCSPATVSRVINRVGQVSEAMRERVMRAARKAGYSVESDNAGVPQLVPQGRNGRKVNTASGYIEIVLHRHSPFEPVSLSAGKLEVSALKTAEPTEAGSAADAFPLSHSFYTSLVNGMLGEVARWGRQAVLKPNDNLLRADFLDEVNASDKAGVLLAGEYSADIDAFLSACRKPLVLVDLFTDSNTPVVTMDSARGIAAAFDHLRELGHRHIGFAGGPPDVAKRTGRHTAYEWKMATAGFPIRPEWVFLDSPHMIHVREWAQSLLASRERPTAMLCQNDFTALAIVQAWQAAGLRIPEDLSVVGFDDIEVATLVQPRLTSVRVPTVDIGRLAVQQLMLQIASPAALSQRISVAPELIVRESTGPCGRREA
jgi:DNA-binding LacI/PurR family transcriptional regulator